MRHIPLEGGPARPLAAMREWSGPNLICLSRAPRPPVASLVQTPEVGSENEEAEPGEDSASGAKQELRGMSAKSALNLARVLSSLDWGKLGTCVHLTLTYHRSWPKTKLELAVAKSWVTKEVGPHVDGAIWRLEYQRRTKPSVHYVPHWHLLAWIGTREVGDWTQWARRWWREYSGNGHEQGVHVTSGTQARGAWYLAMHASKREQSPGFRVGRWWGYVRRTALLGAQDLREVGEVEERERVWWARLYRRSTGGRTRSNSGFSWFLPRQWQQTVRGWVRDRVSTERERMHRAKEPF